MEILNEIFLAIQQVYTWIFNPFDTLEQIMVWMYTYAIKFFIYLSYIALQASFVVAQEMVAGFAADERVNSLYNAIPTDIRSLLSVFRIPEGLNMIMSAVFTNFAYNASK